LLRAVLQPAGLRRHPRRVAQSRRVARNRLPHHHLGIVGCRFSRVLARHSQVLKTGPDTSLDALPR